MQREKPIIFNSEMIKAILDDRKTQTRRVIKPQPDSRHCRIDFENGILKESSRTSGCWHVGRTGKPRYKVGDLLYVRETFYTTGAGVGGISYKANGDWIGEDDKWTSPMGMPKACSRIWLEITNIRVERIQRTITKDILAEGIIDQRCGADGLMCDFAELWNSINKKRGYGWEKNPWVWVYDFKRIDK